MESGLGGTLLAGSWGSRPVGKGHVFWQPFFSFQSLVKHTGSRKQPLCYPLSKRGVFRCTQKNPLVSFECNVWLVEVVGFKSWLGSGGRCSVILLSCDLSDTSIVQEAINCLNELWGVISSSACCLFERLLCWVGILTCFAQMYFKS